MKKLSSYILEHKFGFLIGIVSLLISVTLDMLFPQITLHLVDDVIIGGKMGELRFLLISLLTLGLGRCIFQYTKEYSFDRLGSRIGTDIRKDLFHHVQGLSPDYFDRTNTGELMSRIKDDVDRIWDAVSFIIMLLIEVIVHTVLVLVCMARISPVLTIVPALAMILSGSLAIYMEQKLGAVYEEISEENAVLNTVAEENLAGVRTVKSFAREKYEIKKFMKHNERFYELNVKQSKVWVTYYPYFQIITKILPILVLLFGGILYIQKGMTLGNLSAFVEYSMNIVWPMEMLGWLSNSFSSALASNKKLKKIYAEIASIKEPEEPVTLENVQGKITFDHVSFEKTVPTKDGKENKVKILEDISFTVEPGETIGIMGATGAGKSSIIHLLQRLYDATEGTILLDDVDIKTLSLNQLRSSISVVMQDVFLFSDSINENIKLGKSDRTDEDTIRIAARRAQASSFIEGMDKKYETIIGERGVGLSGGQKQRISIARAIAKKDPILVMDDSTSALDMETEHSIQQELKTLDHTTKIIVAHRISAVRHAKELILLENGRIAERGTHEQLLLKKGLYYETYMAQYGEFEAERSEA